MNMATATVLRLGRLGDGPVMLKPGDAFRLDMDHEMLGDERRAPLPYSHVYGTLRAGAEVLIDGGRVRLRVESVGPEHAETRVIVGGMVADDQQVALGDPAWPACL